jgi:hypothetical protein
MMVDAMEHNLMLKTHDCYSLSKVFERFQPANCRYDKFWNKIKTFVEGGELKPAIEELSNYQNFQFSKPEQEVESCATGASPLKWA